MIQKLYCPDCAAKRALNDQDHFDGWVARQMPGWLRDEVPYDPEDEDVGYYMGKYCNGCRLFISVKKPVIAVTFWQPACESEPDDWESETIQLIKNVNCDGTYCTSPNAEVRVTENVVDEVLCYACYEWEQHWRRESPAQVELLPQWESMDVYRGEDYQSPKAEPENVPAP